MKFPSNLHTHTTFSDGKNTPEQIIQAALEKGFISIGFSDHSDSPDITDYFDFPRDNLCNYCRHLDQLKEVYRDQIEIYTGVEWDYYTDPDYHRGDLRFDYVIGAVHYAYDPRYSSKHYTIDGPLELLLPAVGQMTPGIKGLVQNYYEGVTNLVLEKQPDIVAHFDLIRKNNAGNRLFDEQDGWYRDAVNQALDAIQRQGAIVELNTGGIYRGYTNLPYPSPFILEMIKEKSIPVTLGSDSHTIESLDHYFPEALEILRGKGFTSVKMLQGGAFADYPIC